MTFAQRLRKTRKEKGFSQEQLAERLEVSRQAVSKWESELAYPEAEKLIALSQVLEVSTDYLLKGEEACHQEEKQRRQIVIELSGRGKSYEYRSKRTVCGLPLLHINLGRGKKMAKGIIAIGNISLGVISVGILSAGLCSFGIVAAGLLGIAVIAAGLFSIGAVAVGGIALGAIAVGYLAVGALSFGVYAIGACASGLELAAGYRASGFAAIGHLAEGTHRLLDKGNTGSFPSGVLSREEVRVFLSEVCPEIPDWILKLFLSIFG